MITLIREKDMLNTNELEEYKSTYSNRQRSLRMLNSNKDISYVLEELSRILELDNVEFSKACLSDFYHYKFSKEVIAVSMQKIEYLESNFELYDNEQQEGLKFLIKKLEHRIKNYETEPNYLKEHIAITKTQPAELRDFFKEQVNDNVIEKIQEKFKHLKGKEMAILLHLLNYERKLLNIDNNDRKRKSRIHFVRCFTETHLKSVQSISNFLSYDGSLRIDTKNDPKFETIEKQLEKIVSNC